MSNTLDTLGADYRLKPTTTAVRRYRREAHQFLRSVATHLRDLDPTRVEITTSREIDFRVPGNVTLDMTFGADTLYVWLHQGSFSTRPDGLVAEVRTCVTSRAGKLILRDRQIPIDTADTVAAAVREIWRTTMHERP